jgi:CheY-like chemotaxis protein
MPKAALKTSSFSRINRNHAHNGKSTRVDSAVKNGKPLLLWIDDYKPGLSLYKSMFESQGFRVLTANSGTAGLQLASKNAVDVAVTDYEMADMDGGAVADGLKRMTPSVPVVIFSGSLGIPEHVKNRVDRVCDKAGSREDLFQAVRQVVDEKRGTRVANRSFCRRAQA